MITPDLRASVPADPATRPRWPVGGATGVGSMPGIDVRESTRVVLGEVPDLPALPELPNRGAGADMIGRTLALLPGFAAETVPTGWRLTQRPGADVRRALSWLEQDLDTFEELAADHDGQLKVAVAGPLTLAASVELASGERLLGDHGAVRDLAASLAEAVGAHVAELRRRLPRAELVLQVDEPALTAVLRAQVPTASGLATMRRVDEPVVDSLVRQVLDAASAAGATPVVHSCASEVPVDLLRRAGARGISLDATLVPSDGSRDEALGECVDAGVMLLLGIDTTAATDAMDASAASEESGSSDVAGTVDPVRRLWRRLGFPPERFASSVVISPTCGLAGSSGPDARAALTRARRAARLLVEDPEADA